MSRIEDTPKNPVNRTAALQQAVDFINENPLLERDGLTLEMRDKKFIVDSEETDPLTWAQDRLKWLKENPDGKADDTRRHLEDDLKNRQGN